MNVKQISIFLENKPGTLHDIVETLLSNDIHIKSFTAVDLGGITVLRIIVDNILWTASILKNFGCTASFTEVILINIAGVAGGLTRVLDILKHNQINIEHVYPLMGRKSRSINAEEYSLYMIFEVNDVVKAAEVLTQQGIKITNQEELAAL